MTIGMAEVTSNGVAHLFAQDMGGQPLNLQVLGIEKLPMTEDREHLGDRWKLLLSDGSASCLAALSSSENHLLSENVLRELCVVQIKEWSVNHSHAKPFCIALRVEVISAPVGKIGNPVPYNASAGAG
eukprot:CAMPEP_0119132470 /NCGR_PEP_ID=MMETSP1310-20130426/11857_1 /TAXON_ID=464262 /ORGANISM="Genus nov. species nov., Strain RCC2339" /LENGTH=127 /DNA_ID=CAMNT_0007123107 /DNA_START=83 /DNA_END=463 /DNA_ORIENTATION=+